MGELLKIVNSKQFYEFSLSSFVCVIDFKIFNVTLIFEECINNKQNLNFFNYFTKFTVAS